MSFIRCNNPDETRLLYSIPQWMIEAVDSMMRIDKMDERQIARILHVGAIQVRLARWWARYGWKFFMDEPAT